MLAKKEVHALIPNLQNMHNFVNRNCLGCVACVVESQEIQQKIFLLNNCIQQ